MARKPKQASKPSAPPVKPRQHRKRKVKKAWDNLVLAYTGNFLLLVSASVVILTLAYLFRAAFDWLGKL
jgi:hypothetical protein